MSPTTALRTLTAAEVLERALRPDRQPEPDRLGEMSEVRGSGNQGHVVVEA